MVEPLIPLSILQAVRAADWPVGASEAEYVPEFLNKRLGTTDTVYAQIRRYTEAVKRKQRVSASEVVALCHLIGRRPDAEIVFREAGITTSREAYSEIGGMVRVLLHSLPRLVARPIARRRAKKILRKYFNARLERYGADYRMKLPEERVVTATIHRKTASATMGDTASSYYEAGLVELLSLLRLQ